MATRSRFVLMPSLALVILSMTQAKLLHDVIDHDCPSAVLTSCDFHHHSHDPCTPVDDHEAPVHGDQEDCQICDMIAKWSLIDTATPSTVSTGTIFVSALPNHPDLIHAIDVGRSCGTRGPPARTFL